MGIIEQERRSRNKRTKSIYLVVCEGKNKTEYTYLNHFISRNSKIILHVEKSESTDPKNMIKTTLHYIEKYRIQSPHDKAFCLIDVDVNKSRSDLINELVTTYPDITIIRSNACFEVWFILHFTPHPKVQPTSKHTKAELRNHISDYRESLDVYEKEKIIRDNISTAIKNAKSLRKQHQRNGVNLDSVDAMPYTEFDKLIEDIMSKNS